MTRLLDSVILIDHFNGVGEATSYIASVKREACLSVITRAEVLVGFDEMAAAPARRVLDRFPTLPISRDDADAAAVLRRLYRWKLPDALQAALAMRHGLRLVTRNTRDFDPEQHPFVDVPYTL